MKVEVPSCPPWRPGRWYRCPRRPRSWPWRRTLPPRRLLRPSSSPPSFLRTAAVGGSGGREDEDEEKKEDEEEEDVQEGVFRDRPAREEGRAWAPSLLLPHRLLRGRRFPGGGRVPAGSCSGI